MVLTKTRGILGMNARNLLYISKYNSAANKKFADDKIFTKQFLESRGIGVAKLYHIIKNHQQLTHDFFAGLPNAFVIKPNRGYAGGGILVVTEKKNKKWITVSGKKLDEEFLFRHCIDILEGKYSISGVHDQVIFEEVLEPHPDFRLLTDVGLPDVRLIVFNLVPVMAMARIPTTESDGKANMELGAIAMGIDIGTGKTTGGAYYSQYIKKMPNGQSAVGFQIPYWDEILHTVTKIQNYTKIGYLGVDMVISKTGVKVLELNARSGLKIQVANRIPLRARLEKITDLKVLTPEEGVDVAKTLFSQKGAPTKEEVKESKPVVGILEPVILYREGEKPQTLLAKISLSAEKSVLSEKYYDGPMMDISMAGKRLKIPTEKKRLRGEEDLILAGKHLKEFFIDPNKEFKKIDPTLLTANLDEKVIKNLDEKICEIDAKIKILAFLNPQNLAEQKAIFLSHPEFSPRFFYREYNLDFDQFRSDLKKLPQPKEHFLYPLYKEKIKNIEAKLELLESIDAPDFREHSKKCFGDVTQALYRSALKFLRENADKTNPDESEELDTKNTESILQDFLKEKKLAHWKIQIIEDSVADIQVTKKNVILLKKNATFRENRLRALLAHEIGTHVFRFENGKVQPLRILERGTANYLRTEEGLAIWNQNQLGLDLGEKYLTPALLVIAIYMAEKMSFRDLFHYLKNTHNLDNDLAWKLCVKSKRGLKNTETKTAFTKDAIYFQGDQDIEKFVKEGGNIADLYVGKINIEDLPVISQIEDLKPAKFLL